MKRSADSQLTRETLDDEDDNSTVRPAFYDLLLLAYAFLFLLFVNPCCYSIRNDATRVWSFLELDA
jgi:hypothetical protein